MTEPIPPDLVAQVAHALQRIRAERPLIHNITNYVVMNYTANVLLALGASPIMAHAPEEVEELASAAGSLVVNIGTLSRPWIESMFRAGRAAKSAHVPVVLDPVGAGATGLRTETARRFFSEIQPLVVRANASETLALCREGAGKGVDATHAVDEAMRWAQDLAARCGTVFAVTGKEDCVTDGHRQIRILNGHPLMSRVTGTGCAATVIVAAFCAVESDPLIAAASGLTVFGIAGEMAAEGDPGPGTFAVRLLDALQRIDEGIIASRARIC
ncbi:MAG TPA: hydroxyethylthiazole kinase [Kiritimatiellae bacterium]|nr:hydroxyethylthiazole kinase [Kiritimatiellia bacterium]